MQGLPRTPEYGRLPYHPGEQALERESSSHTKMHKPSTMVASKLRRLALEWENVGQGGGPTSTLECQGLMPFGLFCCSRDS